MKTAILIVLSASLLMGCRSAVQGDARYDTNAVRSKITAVLPPGWSLIPHQDETQRFIASGCFTDPRTDAFILVGPKPNYIGWTDKQAASHREYLAKECLYIWVMPAAFKPKFRRGLKVGPPPPLIYKSDVIRVYGWVSHYIADTNRAALILKQATEISSPDIHLSWVHWRRDLAAGFKR